MEPRDRLLARIAALREADRALLEARLGGQHALVELAAEAWRGGQDAQPLELVGGDALGAVRRVGVEQLAGGNAVVVVRHAALDLPEDERRDMLLRLDRALRGEAEARKLGAQSLAELRLGQQQEVVLPAAQHYQRRDESGLRREQQRLARLAGSERLDVVGHHALQVGGGIRSGDGDERPRPRGRP
ncbi:hypothetical protein Gocc_3064 [Gaiella occulta]|uniref:Uncharacterized protein n=1 Tax=Gaiella occulta TaxID=1002870 RepID=A0A7M2YUH3_9ACTN|nr:hypothetical protein Gocc_3064 [Gaiella occulta]